MAFAYIGVSNGISTSGTYGNSLTTFAGFDRVNNKAYWTGGGLLNSYSDWIWILDLNTFTLSKVSGSSFLVLSSAYTKYPSIYNPVDGYIYIVTDGSYFIRQVNASTMALTGVSVDTRTHLGGSVYGMALSSDGKTLYVMTIYGGGGVDQYGAYSLPSLTFSTGHNFTETSGLQYELFNDDTNGLLYAIAYGSPPNIVKVNRSGVSTFVTPSPTNGNNIITSAYDSGKSKLYYSFQSYPGTSMVLEKYSAPGLTQDTNATISAYYPASTGGNSLGLDNNANWLYMYANRNSDNKLGVVRTTTGLTFDSFVLDGSTGNAAPNLSTSRNMGFVLDLTNLFAYALRISSDGQMRVSKFSIDPPVPTTRTGGNIGAGLKKPANIYDWNRIMGGY